MLLLIVSEFTTKKKKKWKEKKIEQKTKLKLNFQKFIETKRNHFATFMREEKYQGDCLVDALTPLYIAIHFDEKAYLKLWELPDKYLFNITYTCIQATYKHIPNIKRMLNYI